MLNKVFAGLVIAFWAAMMTALLRVDVFPRPPALNRIVRSRAEINIDVVDVAHDVFVIAERRHDLGFAAAEILFTTNNNPIKFRVIDSFH